MPALVALRKLKGQAVAQTEKVLFHFTEAAILPAIRAGGLLPSPLSIPGGQQTIAVVSLTSRPDPRGLVGKSLTDGGLLSGENLAAYRHFHNDPFGSPPATKNTCECRIELRIPEKDGLLHNLGVRAAALGFSAKTLAKFIRLGGGSRSSWWIYEGVLSPSYIHEVRKRPVKASRQAGR
jgi:hypothetical protein